MEKVCRNPADASEVGKSRTDTDSAEVGTLAFVLQKPRTVERRLRQFLGARDLGGNPEPAQLDVMTETRALGAEHASLLCDRVAEHSRAQLAAFGNARGEFHENIIDVLLVEEESSASLSAAVTERLASMDTRLVNLALEYADALCREVDAEVAENERAAEAISRRIVRERVSFLERAREKLVAARADTRRSEAKETENTHTQKNRESSIAAIDRELAELRSKALRVAGRAFEPRAPPTVFPNTTRDSETRDDARGVSRAAAASDCLRAETHRECVAAREDIDAIHAVATRARARARREERDAVREEVFAARRTLLREGRTSESVRSRRDDLAAMRGEATRETRERRNTDASLCAL
jgi:hypothetical protein